MSRRRGVSLLELVVAAGLAGLVLALIVQVLRPGLRAWVKGAHKSEVQQGCLIALSRLTEEYRNAHADSVRVTNDVSRDEQGRERHRDAIVFLSLLDSKGRMATTPDGDPKWQRWVYLYHDGDGNHIRWQEIPLATPDVSPDLHAVPILVKSDTDRIVAHYVRSFDLDESALPRLGITVEAESGEYRSANRSSALPNLMTLAPPASSATAAPPPSSPPHRGGLILPGH